jgi:hypothetical protein
MQVRASWALREAFSAMSVTSFTTASAFFGSAVSRIEPIRAFGEFMGGLVLAMLVLVCTVFAAGTVLVTKRSQLAADRRRRQRTRERERNGPAPLRFPFGNPALREAVAAISFSHEPTVAGKLQLAVLKGRARLASKSKPAHSSSWSRRALEELHGQVWCTAAAGWPTALC